LATEATPYYSLLRLLFIIENKKLTLIKTNLSKEKKFDLIIVNPPYGIKNEKFGTKFGKTSSLEISTLYNSLEHLSTDGKLIGIFSEGLLFKSQSEFAQARKILKKETRIEAIIALPSGGVGAFTGIKTNLLLLKNTSPKTNKTVFVNLRVLWSLNWSELNQKIKKIIISKKATKSDIVFIISQDEINVENFSIESNNPLFSIELEKIQQKFETIKLGSRTDIIRGINSSLQTNIDSKIQLLQIRDLSNGRIQSDVIRYVSENSIKESSRLTTKNDILISVKGTIGKVALIGPTDVGKAISDSLVIIRPRNIDPLYLFYILQSDFLKMQLESATTGAVIKGISSAKLKEIIIPLPPAATKKEFSTKMNDLDIQLKKVEEERKKLTEEISKMKKEVYDLVFK
jgi:type I restriction-modification system DNA methylase subunit